MWKRPQRIRVIPFVPVKLTGQQTGPFRYSACVWDYTINHNNNNNTQQAGPEPGGGSNKHPIYLADYPGEALLFATWEGGFFVVSFFFWWGGGDDVATTIILQQRKKKAENRPEKWA